MWGVVEINLNFFTDTDTLSPSKSFWMVRLLLNFSGGSDAWPWETLKVMPKLGSLGSQTHLIEDGFLVNWNQDSVVYRTAGSGCFLEVVRCITSPLLPVYSCRKNHVWHYVKKVVKHLKARKAISKQNWNPKPETTKPHRKDTHLWSSLIPSSSNKNRSPSQARQIYSDLRPARLKWIQTLTQQNWKTWKKTDPPQNIIPCENSNSGGEFNTFKPLQKPTEPS